MASRDTGVPAARVVREVYDEHYGRLVGWTTRLVGDPDLAHDFVTEGFVKLLRNWDTVNEPRPWLHATVANLVRDHWRRRGRESVAYERLQAGGRGTEDDTSGDLTADLSVRNAVQLLPDRLRSPVLRHYFADLTVVQVAHQLGKSEGTIKRDLYDARHLLAAHLEGVR